MPNCLKCGAYYIRSPCPTCSFEDSNLEVAEESRASELLTWFMKGIKNEDEGQTQEFKINKTPSDIYKSLNIQKEELQSFFHQIKALKIELETRAIRLKKQGKLITALKQELLDKNNRIIALQSQQIQLLTEKIAHLETEAKFRGKILQEQKTTISALKQELHNKTSKIEHLEESLEEKNQTIHSFQNRHSEEYTLSLEKQRDEALIRAERAQTRIKKLEEEKKNLEIEKQVKTQVIEQLKEQASPSISRKEIIDSPTPDFIEDEAMMEAFLQEFKELHELAQNALDALFRGDNSHIFDLYRAFHTWKGSAGLMGFQHLFQLLNAYCEFLRPIKDSNSSMLTSNQLDLIKECLITLKEFQSSIIAGSKGEHILVTPLIEAIELESQ